MVASRSLKARGERMISIFTMFGASFTLAVLLMILLWGIYLIQRNAAIADIGWGVGFILAAWAYFFLGYGDFFKRLVLTLMVTIWAGRLTYHLYDRYREFDEDPRYRYLQEKWGADSPSIFFLILFIFQAVLIVILSLPFFLVNFGSHSIWTHWEAWGILLWLIGMVGESIADAQLAAFRKNPANQDQVYQKGLWRFSRHPNYFFEMLIWIGYYLFAVPSEWGALAVIIAQSFWNSHH
jgi:steroid 5-alpha reductase family enzyme